MSDNPYDALDDANPYDALDAPKAASSSSAPNPADDSGLPWYQGNAAAGAGKAVFDLWRGVRQNYARASDAITGKNTAGPIQQEQDEVEARDRPLMQTGAGLAGNIAGNVAMSALPFGVAAEGAGALGLARTAEGLSGLANPNTWRAAGAAGALQGALQPTGKDDSQLWNTVAGTAGGEVGQAAGKVLGSIAQPIANTLSDAGNGAVAALQKAGVPLDLAQRTGSVMLQRAKAMLSDNPLTAGAQADMADMQKKTFTRAVLSTMGEYSDTASRDVMGGAKDRLGNVYDDVASRINIPYSDIETPLSHIQIEARKVLNDQQFGVVNRNIDDIVNKASQNGGAIDGEQFQNIKKTLDRLSGGADSDVGNVARDMRQVLQSGLLTSAQRSGNQIDVAALKNANQQWGNMRKIEGAIDTMGEGQISPSKLANALGTKANRYNSVYGQGDTSLVDLAQAGKLLLPDKIQQSGTAPRLLAQAALGAAPAAAAGIYEGARTGDLKKGLATAGGVYILPKLGQKIINNQGGMADYLTKGLKSQSLRGLLQSPTNSTLVGGALKRTPLSSLLSLQNQYPATEEEGQQ